MDFDKHSFRSFGNPVHSIVLKDGRIALGSEDIYILESEDLELRYRIKVPCIYFIKLKNGKLAVVISEDNKIIIIECEEYNYYILQIIDIASFNALDQLWNGTLIGCAKEQLMFFKEENNSYVKTFSIKLKETYKFVLQTKKGEIDYSDGKDTNRIIFYDFINKKKLQLLKVLKLDKVIFLR